MIEKVKIRGYRKIQDLTFIPNPHVNILVGDNESGKSTLLEAIGLALTGRINGRPAYEELNPFWFNQSDVAAFFSARANGQKVIPPFIEIEVFLSDRDEFARNLTGGHSSDIPTRECAGVKMRIQLNEDYASEFEAHVSSSTEIIPVEYYEVDWRTFKDIVLTARPKELTTSVIDSRTVRSSNAVDFHMRQILNDRLQPEVKAQVSSAFRRIKEQMTAEHLKTINDELQEVEGSLNGTAISLAMDQSSKGSWDTSVVPHVSNLPIGMSGQGQQASLKIALAMSRNAERAQVVMVEEPENHLSHTSLNVLLRRIVNLTSEDQQLFITTHSSYVLNRLGLDGLKLVSDGKVSTFEELSNETVRYFQKLPGYDTLRMVLAEKFILVEGPSDEILFERFYRDLTGKTPIQDGIDVFSMRGLSLARCLELAKLLDKQCAVLRDNDGQTHGEIMAGLAELVEDTRREVFISDKASGKTLEPQLLSANPDLDQMRQILKITSRADPETWMTNNKTEAAIRIAESSMRLAVPGYFSKAIEFIRG